MLKNLGNAIKRTLDLNQAALCAMTGAIAGFKTEKATTPEPSAMAEKPALQEVSLPYKPRGGRPKKESVTKNDLRLKQVKELQAQGYSICQMGNTRRCTS